MKHLYNSRYNKQIGKQYEKLKPNNLDKARRTQAHEE